MNHEKCILAITKFCDDDDEEEQLYLSVAVLGALALFGFGFGMKVLHAFKIQFTTYESECWDSIGVHAL